MFVIVSQFRLGFLACSTTLAVIFHCPSCGGYVAWFDRSGRRYTGHHTLRVLSGGAVVIPADTRSSRSLLLLAELIFKGGLGDALDVSVSLYGLMALGGLFG